MYVLLFTFAFNLVHRMHRWQLQIGGSGLWRMLGVCCWKLAIGGSGD
jgi:hypothetical protein